VVNHKGREEMKLQVFIDGEWKYVFCYNGAKIITIDKKDLENSEYKAIEVFEDTLPFFRNKFANMIFRAKATVKSPRLDFEEHQKGIEYHFGFYQRTGKKYFMRSFIVDKIIEEKCGSCLVSFYTASIRKVRRWESEYIAQGKTR
jgi:hypothetical protein